MNQPYYQDDSVTLYHGDCLQNTQWLEADVLVTDPPYGAQDNRGYGGRTQVHGTNGFRITGDTGTTIRDTVLTTWGDRPTCCFASPRICEPPGGWKYRLVWFKRIPGLGEDPWRYNHELIFVRGEGWVRADSHSFSVIEASPDPQHIRTAHPHMKPVQLLQRLIMSAPPGVITDPFTGAGSTLIAAKAQGRRAIGVEIEERYCEIAAKRLAQDTLFSEPA